LFCLAIIVSFAIRGNDDAERLKPVAHDAGLLAKLEFCHRIGCNTDVDGTAANTMARF